MRLSASFARPASLTRGTDSARPRLLAPCARAFVARIASIELAEAFATGRERLLRLELFFCAAWSLISVLSAESLVVAPAIGGKSSRTPTKCTLPEQIDLRRTVDVGGGCGDGCRRSVLVVLHLVGSQRCDELRVFRKQQAARDAREGPRDAQAVPHQLDGLDLVHLVEDDVRHAPAGQLPGPVCGVAFRGRRPDGHERIALVDDVLELDSKMEGHQALCLCLGS
eukprot:scaffold1187_cov258-Pinguiococcus_pyrenoidosus.AAC.19